MLSSKKGKKFQKVLKDGILGLEMYPPGAISIISLHTAAFSYWLVYIRFSLVFDLECTVLLGFVNCALKVGNLWSRSPSLFADKQAQRTPLGNWDPQNTQILGLALWECWASSSCSLNSALPLKLSRAIDTRTDRSPKDITFQVGSIGSQGVQDGSALGTLVSDCAKATKSFSSIWQSRIFPFY